jgi:hypothetical protein
MHQSKPFFLTVENLSMYKMTDVHVAIRICAPLGRHKKLIQRFFSVALNPANKIESNTRTKNKKL